MPLDGAVFTVYTRNRLVVHCEAFTVGTWATWTDAPPEPGGALADEIDIRDIGHTAWTVVPVGYDLRDEAADGVPCDCGMHGLGTPGGSGDR